MNVKISFLATALIFVSQAHAGLLGSTVVPQYYAFGGPYSEFGSIPFTANGTVQNRFLDYYTLTVRNNQVEYNFLTTVTWSASQTSLDESGLYITNGNLLTFYDAPQISSVAISADSSYSSGFSLANITYNTSNLATNWQNVTFAAGDKLILDVTTVPEPSIYALLVVGLLATSFSLRRHTRMH